LVYFVRNYHRTKVDVYMGRTSREGRSKTPAADRILRAASELFYREGIRAVGVDAIAAEADVTKKTLYEKYGSKDRLIAAYLRARDERWRSWLLGVVERRGGTVRERTREPQGLRFRERRGGATTRRPSRSGGGDGAEGMDARIPG
jgi:AcrR family transcriptional regulator